MAGSVNDLVGELATLYDRLDGLTYYQVLAIDELADYIAVRDAFHQRAQAFHPDRFVFLEGESVKRAAYTVYKRITEAYNVLSDPDLRRRYDDGRAAGQRRLPPEARSRRLDADERKVANPFARMYLCSARRRLAAGDARGAGLDAELGLSLEEAEPLRALRDEAIRRQVRPDLPGERP
jgi:DnaJ-class molecular chaperone